MGKNPTNKKSSCFSRCFHMESPLFNSSLICQQTSKFFFCYLTLCCLLPAAWPTDQVQTGLGMSQCQLSSQPSCTPSPLHQLWATPWQFEVSYPFLLLSFFFLFFFFLKIQINDICKTLCVIPNFVVLDWPLDKFV